VRWGCRQKLVDFGKQAPMVLLTVLLVVCEAFTVVGSNWTGLCRDFSQLTDLEAAVVLLHEALHHAGVTEWPLDPDARRSSEISADVGRRCGLLSGR
jgi:hypothetical protein